MRKHLSHAIKLIDDRSYGEHISYKLCATIRTASGKKLVSQGFNRSFCGHFRTQLCSIYSIVDFSNAIHAEADAIDKAKALGYHKSLEGASIFVARKKPDGSIGTAKPCEKCLQFICVHNLKRICFTIDNETYGIWDLPNSANNGGGGAIPFEELLKNQENEIRIKYW